METTKSKWRVVLGHPTINHPCPEKFKHLSGQIMLPSANSFYAISGFAQDDVFENINDAYKFAEYLANNNDRWTYEVKEFNQ